MGCASSGTKKLDSNWMTKIQPGVTTRNDLLSWFSQPTAQDMDTSGKVSWTWVHFEVHAAPFWSDMKSQTLSVILDTNGIVEHVSVADGMKK